MSPRPKVCGPRLKPGLSPSYQALNAWFPGLFQTGGGVPGKNSSSHPREPGGLRLGRLRGLPMRRPLAKDCETAREEEESVPERELRP